MERILVALLGLAACLAGCSSAPAVTLATARLDFDPGHDRWLPEGSPDGDELKRGNTFGTTVSWTGPGPAARIVVRLKPSRNPGSSSNSGSGTLPDLFFEQELNPAWSFPPDEAPAIAGTQALEVSIVLPAGASARLVASCFDFAATASISCRLAEVPPGSRRHP